MAASALLMTSIGVWACRWRELRPINFGGVGGSITAGAAVADSDLEAAASAAIEEDDAGSVGYGRGRGRGRGRDGAGVYEMVAMKEETDGVSR